MGLKHFKRKEKMMKNKPEILSPAGSWESLKAAAATGADAVYFGGSSFNARRNAGNFSDMEIPNVVAYCHARGIKTYLTLNTVVFDSEIEQAVKLAEIACEAGIDGILLQDAGLASIIHKAAPTVKLCASTQMSVHNIHGVKELEKMGFSRVVLSRELSKKEIYAILRESPLEIEVFVHGALCMSVSGQCYMSAFFGNCRSANRGLCAQPCRLPFSVDRQKYVLSLKDLSIIDHIPELAELGVSSFKIEGRMKRPEYVAAATSICRKALDGQLPTDEDKKALCAVFSRDGFTSGYFDGITGCRMFGIRERQENCAVLPLLKRFRNLYENVERQRIKVDFDFTLTRNSVTLKATDIDGNSEIVNGELPEKAVNRAIDEKTVGEKLSKTGSTPFFAGKVNVSLEPGLTVPVSEINKMRREALDKLFFARKKPKSVFFNINYKTEDISLPHSFGNTKKIRLRFQSISQVPKKLDYKDVELLCIPLKEVSEGKAESLLKSGVRICAELPRVMFSGTIDEELIRAKAAGIKDALCGNIGAIECARRAGLIIHGDFGLNVTNSESLKTFADNGMESCVLSFETSIVNIKTISEKKAVPCGVIVYGRLPLMLVRNCPVKSFRGCRTGSCSIKDRMGIEFPLLCSHDNSASQILNSRPLWLADKKDEIENTGIDFAELYFTTENAQQAADAITAWRRSSECEGKFTRGMYFHSVE
jgi:putative protease